MDLESFTWPNPISRPAGLQELVKASVHFNRNNNSCGAPLAVIAMAKRMVWCFSFSHVACWSFWRSPNWLLFTVFSFVQIFFSNSLQAECLLGHYFKWLPKYIDIRNTLFFFTEWICSYMDEETHPKIHTQTIASLNLNNLSNKSGDVSEPTDKMKNKKLAKSWGSGLVLWGLIYIYSWWFNPDLRGCNPYL